MGNSFDARTRTIGSILGNFERRVVSVPRFQRGYSWEKTHVLAFWDDLVAFSEEYQKHPKSATYFMGPIVIQDGEDEIIILDGQQRLATATILFATLRDAARTLSFPKATPGYDFARDIQRTLIEKVDNDPPYSLQLGELDNQFFQLTLQRDPPDELEAKLRSHDLLKNAGKTLRSVLDKHIQGLTPDLALKELKKINDCLAKGVTVVAIDVKSEDDAYSIFETLNDRGLKLSVPDLLLNLLMRRAGNENERVQVRQQWDYMLEHMGRRDISRFVRHMWLANFGDLKSRGLYNELKDYLKAGDGGEISSVDFAARCANDCDAYISLIEQNAGVPDASRNYVAGLVKYLNITSALPLLLSGLQCLDAKDFVKLADWTAALGVRYLIANLNPNTLESAFYEAARDIRKSSLACTPSSKCLEIAKTLLAKLNPTNALVATSAKEATFVRAAALWILTRLANSLQSETQEVAMSLANLEHIYPQNSTVLHWPNKLDMDPYVWALGNLTILGTKLNRDAGNKSYKDKCDQYYTRSEVKMTQDILRHTVWTPAAVSERGAELSELINKVFPGPL